MRDLVALRFERVAEAVEDACALGDGDVAPGALRRAGAIERASISAALGERTLDVDAVVDGRDDFEHVVSQC